MTAFNMGESCKMDGIVSASLNVRLPAWLWPGCLLGCLPAQKVEDGAYGLPSDGPRETLPDTEHCASLGKRQGQKGEDPGSKGSGALSVLPQATISLSPLSFNVLLLNFSTPLPKLPLGRTDHGLLEI
uniref:Uncharacterized protein n=1 Tax=Molossus molossus TaxID=27622 RepID=A0A7J8DBV0_MOLMO|nr:hypothetical protein HJG59_009319 [Molossus molossus]